MACLHDHSCEEHDCGSEWSLFKHIDMPKVSALNEAIAGSVKSVFKAWESRLDSSEGFLESNDGDPELLVFIPPTLPCQAAFTSHALNWSLLLMLLRHAVSSPSTCRSSLKRCDLICRCVIVLYAETHHQFSNHQPVCSTPSCRSRFTSDVKIKSISVVGGADGTSPSKMRAFINRDGIDFSDAQNMQPVQEWELAENVQGLLEYQTRYSRFQSVGNLILHFPENFGGDTTQIYYIGLRGEATQLKRDAVAKVVYELMPNPSDHKVKNEAGGGISKV